MKKDVILRSILDIGVAPVVRTSSAESAILAIEAVYRGGIRAAEIRNLSGANASAIDGFDGENRAFGAGGANDGGHSDIQNGAENDIFLHFLLVYPQKL